MATSDEVYKGWTIRRLGGWRRRTAVRAGRASANFHHPRQIKPWIDKQPALFAGDEGFTRTLPLGPSDIVSIERSGDVLVIIVVDGDLASGIAENDMVRIEATGNSELNGEYRVHDVGDCRFTIEALVALDKTITRGRVTLVGAD